MTDAERRACIQAARDQITAVTWYAPQYFKPVYRALEQLRTDPGLPPPARESVIRATTYAGWLVDPGACNENGGLDAIQADVCRELDTLERLLTGDGHGLASGDGPYPSRRFAT